MNGRSILSRLALIGGVWALMCGGPLFAVTYTVTITKNSNGTYSAAKANSFTTKIGTPVDWNIDNKTGDTITLRGTGFTCFVNGAPPASCPLNWPGCVGEVTVPGNSAKTLSGVAQDSGCPGQQANPKLLWHNFNFVVQGPTGPPQNVDPRLEIDKGGVVVGPGLVIVGIIVVAGVTYIIYRQLSQPPQQSVG